MIDRGPPAVPLVSCVPAPCLSHVYTGRVEGLFTGVSFLFPPYEKDRGDWAAAPAIRVGGD